MSVQTTTSIPLSSIANGQQQPTHTSGQAICTAIGVMAVVETVGKVVNTSNCGLVKFQTIPVSTTCDGKLKNTGSLTIVAVKVNGVSPNVDLHASVTVAPDALSMDLVGAPYRNAGCNQKVFNLACFLQDFTMHGYTGNPRPSGDLTWHAVACGQNQDVLEHAVCK
jgi:hypothetical protein